MQTFLVSVCLVAAGSVAAEQTCAAPSTLMVRTNSACNTAIENLMNGSSLQTRQGFQESFKTLVGHWRATKNYSYKQIQTYYQENNSLPDFGDAMKTLVDANSGRLFPAIYSQVISKETDAKAHTKSTSVWARMLKIFGNSLAAMPDDEAQCALSARNDVVEKAEAFLDEMTSSPEFKVDPRISVPLCETGTFYSGTVLGLIAGNDKFIQGLDGFANEAARQMLRGLAGGLMLSSGVLGDKEGDE